MALHQGADIVQGELPYRLVNIGYGVGVAHRHKGKKQAEVPGTDGILQHRAGGGGHRRIQINRHFRRVQLWQAH